MPGEKQKNIRVSIPEKVRYQLWVAAGGRCENLGCNKPLDRNVLTQSKVFLGQHAHIIADSPEGPRGDAELSKKLEHDPDNIMLMCHHCHTTADRDVDTYSAEILRGMKRAHEARIQSLYDLDDARESVPVILRHPIKQSHVPRFLDKDVRIAVLKNSGFGLYPSPEQVSLDFQQGATREDEPQYWAELAKSMKATFDAHMQSVSLRVKASHLSIFAFAPMPLNMQLGVVIGNKTDAMTYQWDRVGQSWLFPRERQLDRQTISFTDVPVLNGQDLALVISLSGEVDAQAVRASAPTLPVVRLGVANPAPMLVEDQEDIRHFRTKLTELMAEIRNKGYRRVHVFPAMPLSLAVEFGRQLLPKADPSILVWDFKNGQFQSMLELNMFC